MFTDNFDARSVAPQQGFDNHPPGMWDAQITNTFAKTTQTNQGMFRVEFTTPVGRIENGYNIWNDSPKAVEIAQKELSALCHATGIYKISFPKDQGGNPILSEAGRELRGGRCKIEVVPQTQKDGSPHPNGYMEVKKIYDANGNEPGKSGVAPQPMQAAPQQQAPAQAGWSQPPQQAQPQQQGGWVQPAPQQQQPQQGWQQGPQAGPQTGQAPSNPAGAPPNGNPPWGR
jgi:hypothetical protein